MKRIMIADVKSVNEGGKSPGHYFSLAQNYKEMFENLLEVDIAGGPIYSCNFSDYVLLPYDDVNAESKIMRKIKTLINCFSALRKAESNYLIFQSNAVATIYVSLLFCKKPRNIYMIQYNQFSIDSIPKKLVYRLVKNKICGILCPTDEIGKVYGIPYFVVPDYCITPRALKRARQQNEPKKFDYAMVGMISKDKGVVEIARVLANTDVTVLIAGKPQSEEIYDELKKIKNSCKNIELVMRYIDEDEYDRYIKSAKYCILNYSKAYSSHSSGVVFDALYRGVPVVGKRCRSLDFVESNELGFIYDDPKDFDFLSLAKDKEKEDYFRRSILEYLNLQLTIPYSIMNFLEKNKKI